MKLSELMKDYTPSESYEGWVTNDDYVFAIDTAPDGSTATKEGDYVVVEMGIAGLDAVKSNHAGQDLYPCWSEHHEDRYAESFLCNR